MFIKKMAAGSLVRGMPARRRKTAISCFKVPRNSKWCLTFSLLRRVLHGIDKVLEDEQQRVRAPFDFLRDVPPELRIKIYSYLSPQNVPPKDRGVAKSGIRLMRDDWEPVSTALFRVNRTIHEEFAAVFYGQATFAICIFNDLTGSANLSMCLGRRGVNNGTWNSLTELDADYICRMRKINFYVVFNITRHETAMRHAGDAALRNLRARIRIERGRLCDLIAQTVEPVRDPLDEVGVYVEVQGTPVSLARHPGGYLHRDAEARLHCRALLAPLRRGLRARREAVVDVWRRPAVYKRRINAMVALAGPRPPYEPAGMLGREMITAYVEAMREEILGRALVRAQL